MLQVFFWFNTFQVFLIRVYWNQWSHTRIKNVGVGTLFQKGLMREHAYDHGRIDERKKRKKKTWHGADKSDIVWSRSFPLSSRYSLCERMRLVCVMQCCITRTAIVLCFIAFSLPRLFFTTATWYTYQRVWYQTGNLDTCRFIRNRYFLRHQDSLGFKRVCDWVSEWLAFSFPFFTHTVTDGSL